MKWRTLDIPVGLLHLRLKIHRVRQGVGSNKALIFNPAILRYVVLCFIDLGLWWRFC